VRESRTPGSTREVGSRAVARSALAKAAFASSRASASSARRVQTSALPGSSWSAASTLPLQLRDRRRPLCVGEREATRARSGVEAAGSLVRLLRAPAGRRAERNHGLERVADALARREGRSAVRSERRRRAAGTANVRRPAASTPLPCPRCSRSPTHNRTAPISQLQRAASTRRSSSNRATRSFGRGAQSLRSRATMRRRPSRARNGRRPRPDFAGGHLVFGFTHLSLRTPSVRCALFERSIRARPVRSRYRTWARACADRKGRRAAGRRNWRSRRLSTGERLDPRLPGQSVRPRATATSSRRASSSSRRTSIRRPYGMAVRALSTLATTADRGAREPASRRRCATPTALPFVRASSSTADLATRSTGANSASTRALGFERLASSRASMRRPGPGRLFGSPPAGRSLFAIAARRGRPSERGVDPTLLEPARSVPVQPQLSQPRCSLPTASARASSRRPSSLRS